MQVESFDDWYSKCTDVVFRDMVHGWQIPGTDWNDAAARLKQRDFYFSTATWSAIKQDTLAGVAATSPISSQITCFMDCCNSQIQLIGWRDYFRVANSAATSQGFLSLLKSLKGTKWQWFSYAIRCEFRISRSNWRDLYAILPQVTASDFDSVHTKFLKDQFTDRKSRVQPPLATIPPSPGHPNSPPRYSHMKCFEGWWRKMRDLEGSPIMSEEAAPLRTKIDEIEKKLPELSHLPFNEHDLFASFNEIDPVNELFTLNETADSIIEKLALSDNYKHQTLVEFRFTTTEKARIPRIFEAFNYKIDGAYFRPARNLSGYGRTSPLSRERGLPEVVFLSEAVRIQDLIKPLTLRHPSRTS